MGFGGMEMALTGFIVCVSVVFPLALTAGIFFFIFKKNKERQQLVQSGMPGQANIIQMGDTGVRINNQPRLSMVLDVQPMAAPGQPPPFQPFRVNHECTVPMMAMAKVSPGITVPVKCDPTNPQNLTIDWGAMGFMM